MIAKDFAVPKAVFEDISKRIEAVRKWSSSEMKLQKNSVSRLHMLVAAAKDGRIFCKNEDQITSLLDVSETIEDAQSFVITHDWLAAFGSALGELKSSGGQTPFPFDKCIFEMRLSGFTVLFLCSFEGENKRCGWFVDMGSGMWTMVSDVESSLAIFTIKQIEAVLIALDSGVASSELIKAPAALNAKRLKSGKDAIQDHRVVLLARQHANRPSTISAPTGRHPRLHFRRGHWRHYEDKKTWINWTLVGNPDLGFIDKHYKL